LRLLVHSGGVGGGGVVQRHVLYLGEINDSQRAAWVRAIEIFDYGGGAKQIALFPEDRVAPALPCDVVSIRLSGMRLRRPRQWGGMGRMLAGDAALGPAPPGRFLASAPAALARGHGLAERPQSPGPSIG
jgi:hypothetical protein